MYLVVEIQKTSDGQLTNLAYAFNDQYEAESKYHAILAAAATSSVPVHSAVLLTEQGMCLLNASYTHEFVDLQDE